MALLKLCKREGAMQLCAAVVVGKSRACLNSSSFNIYIYIYTCVCVCVCIDAAKPGPVDSANEKKRGLITDESAAALALQFACKSYTGRLPSVIYICTYSITIFHGLS